MLLGCVYDCQLPSLFFFFTLEKEENKRVEQGKQQRADTRAKDTSPSLALEKYAGMYDSTILGGATLSVEGDALSGEAVSKRSGLHIQLQAHESISGTLEHWHYDTFLCKWNDPVFGESMIPFITNGQGEVAEFRVRIREDWIDPLEHVFKKLN